LDRWRRRLVWDGSAGSPRSANAASSFHLIWEVPPGEWVAAEVTLDVRHAPVVAALFFWALQVSFVDRGRDGGAAHLGLQWYPPHPGATAVNWGGYHPDGRELDGSVSVLPSATGNVNTRDLAWLPGRAYRLRVCHGDQSSPPGTTAWRGEVTDTATGALVVVRELFAVGDRLAAPMVWSEVFARCDDPGVEVCWSGLRLRSASGAVHEVERVRVNYQARKEGGCATTDVQVDTIGVVQRTRAIRVTPGGSVLAVPAAPVGDPGMGER